MAISVTKSGPYFTSGAISFSAMRNTFRLNNPTGTISASELLRNTDVTNTDPILPDATENSDVEFEPQIPCKFILLTIFLPRFPFHACASMSRLTFVSPLG